MFGLLLVNEALVRDGLAEAVPADTRHDGRLALAEEEAREEGGLGICSLEP